jgi:hypothetical protein
MTITRTRAYTARDEAADFFRRCESSLTVARQTGAPAWKIEALEEALDDAREARDDFDRLLG